MNEERSLKVKNRIAEIKKLYEDSSSQYANILVAGEGKTGKSSLYATCPFPCHIDSFDPGGTTTAVLQPFIKSGDIIVEKFENDDWKSPAAYRDWERSFIEKKKDGYFDYMATYGIDSATNWAISLMGQIMKVGKGKNVKPHPGTSPFESDYLHQQLEASNILRRDIMPLPCHVLVTGHLQFFVDKETELLQTGLLMWGKLAQLFPLVFDETYVTLVKRSSSGGIHEILTQNDGLYRAGTRMGGGGIFEKKEKPDIRALLKKAGKSYEDKPKII